MREWLRQWVEAGLAWALYGLLWSLPLDTASAVGGWMGRNIGYPLPVTRRARRNLERMMPELSPGERENLLLRMWDNLGRTAAEFPHISRIGFATGDRVEYVGLEHLHAAQNTGRGLIFFSAHFGNWEIMAPAAAAHGIPLNLIYRAPNNSRVDRLFRGRGDDDAEVIPKGAAGARRTLQLLHQGKALGLLVDQKMNDGIPVPFFGHDAMTAPALAQFALKFGHAVLPCHVERLGGAHFRVIVEPMLAIPSGIERHEAIQSIMVEVNRVLETWVRAHPEQWLWLHNRWPK